MSNIINQFKQLCVKFYPPEEGQAIFRLVMEKVCNLKPYQFLIGINDSQISDGQKQQLQKIGARLGKMEPIQYILGEADFYGMTFQVAPGVLIPRPETAELVDIVIKENQGKEGKLIDLGTGSGCIAIATAHYLKNWTVYAADISQEALSIAQTNNMRNNTDVRFLQIDILNQEEVNEYIPLNLDVIISNPPYIMEKERKDMDSNVLIYEPEIALFVPDSDPLLFYRNIARIGQQNLNKNGKLYFEINAMCGTMVVQLLKEEGYYNIQIIKDLSGKDRIVKATR